MVTTTPPPSTVDLSEDVGQHLARHVATTPAGALPPEVVRTTTLSILDTLGVSLAATGVAPAAGPVLDYALGLGGPPRSTLLGTGQRVSSPVAAFGNGALAHCLDFDDLNYDLALHTATSTVPGVLALAEANGVGGAEVVAAVALGVDVMTRLNQAVTWKHDWFTTPLLGYLGSAVACSRILGLDADRTFDALGIAFAQAGGTLEMRYSVGSDIAGIYAAWPNQAGVHAAELAARGMGGIEFALEGSRGLFAMFFEGSYDRDGLIRDLGRTYGAAGTSFKPWPSCGLTHSPIDGVLTLMREHRIAPDSVRRLTYVTGNPNAWALCTPLDDRRHPRTAMDARFSIPYSMAVAAVHDGVHLGHFTPQGLADPAVAAMAERVEPVFDESWYSPDPIPRIGVEIATAGGETFSTEVTTSYGRVPSRPMAAADVVAKFRGCAAVARHPMSPSHVDEVVELVLGLDTVDDLGPLFELLRAAPAAAEET